MLPTAAGFGPSTLPPPPGRAGWKEGTGGRPQGRREAKEAVRATSPPLHRHHKSVGAAGESSSLGTGRGGTSYARRLKRKPGTKNTELAEYNKLYRGLNTDKSEPLQGKRPKLHGLSNLWRGLQWAANAPESA